MTAKKAINKVAHTATVKKTKIKAKSKYYYYRDHNWRGGWGVKFSLSTKEGDQSEIIALTFDKNHAFAIADALNKYNDPHKLLEDEEFIEFLKSKK